MGDVWTVPKPPTAYDLFDQCPHRMACARCDFYIPKKSSKAQSIEAKANLLRLTQVSLNEDELRPVKDGIAGHEKLVAKLASLPSLTSKRPRDRVFTLVRDLTR